MTSWALVLHKPYDFYYQSFDFLLKFNQQKTKKTFQLVFTFILNLILLNILINTDSLRGLAFIFTVTVVTVSSICVSMVTVVSVTMVTTVACLGYNGYTCTNTTAVTISVTMVTLVSVVWSYHGYSVVCCDCICVSSSCYSCSTWKRRCCKCFFTFSETSLFCCIFCS